MVKIIIEKNDINQRLDKYLFDSLDDLSRNEIQKMIENEEITVNNLKSKPAYKLRENDEIIIRYVEEEELIIKPEDIALNIIYEDDKIIVINKPSGMVVHPGYGNYEGTLVNALMHYTNKLSLFHGDVRAGIVHRIDKETSGLLVVAKTDAALFALEQQFKNRSVVRKYYALVHGVINHNYGKIDAPITRNKNDRKLMAVSENGKEAISHFNVIERFKNHTLLEVSLETGRTHQIRVHLKYIGYPVVGDNQYGLRKDPYKKGQLLHAKTLGFMHPRNKDYLEFNSELPDEFINYLNNLREEQ